MTIRPGSAVRFGKALEYAVAKNLEEIGVGQLADNPALRVTRQAYLEENQELKQWLDSRATIGNQHLRSIEPRMQAGQLRMLIQSDQAGAHGDVRDIVLTGTQPNWEIGISVKRKHEAMKHSRLSDTIDFGIAWDLGEGCSQEYWDAIKPVFEWLRKLKLEEKNWRDIENKKELVYRPVMEAFRAEIRRICSKRKFQACRAVVHYLIGKYDFYKLIALDGVVKIQAFNLNRKLNVGRNLKLPTALVGNEFKDDSDNTVILIFNHGWTLSFRIHSATTKVEPSLKFDIQLDGQPTNLYTQHLAVPKD